MKWFQIISQLLIQYSIQQQRMKAAPEKIKGMTVQAGIYFLGLCFFAVLGLSAIVMIFIDLGRQWDAGNSTHFSGTIEAALWMFALGTVAFGACIYLAQVLSRRQAAEQKAVADRESAAQAVNPLMVFGEEFIGQLISKLNQK
jgi:hypothetical protein